MCKDKAKYWELQIFPLLFSCLLAFLVQGTSCTPVVVAFEVLPILSVQVSQKPGHAEGEDDGENGKLHLHDHSCR